MAKVLLCIGLLVDAAAFALVGCDTRTPTARIVSLRFQNLRFFPVVSDGNATQLDVSDNDLAIVPEGALAGVPSLRFLDARRNRIRLVGPGVFDGLACLLRVDFSGNQLRHLDPQIFSRNEVLQTLDVSDNPLSVEELESPLMVSASLRVLSAYGTDVRGLTEATLTGLPALEALGLGQVTFVHPEAFRWLERLLVVDLTPVCDSCCDAGAFDGLRGLRASRRIDVNFCEEEHEGSGKVVVALAALVFMIVFTVAVAGPCWYRRHCRGGPSSQVYTGIDRQDNSKITHSEQFTKNGNIYTQETVIEYR